MLLQLIQCSVLLSFFFFFSSRRRHTRCSRDWSSDVCSSDLRPLPIGPDGEGGELRELSRVNLERSATDDLARRGLRDDVFLDVAAEVVRSEEHTSELQSRLHLVCRLLLEKKKKQTI